MESQRDHTSRTRDPVVFQISREMADEIVAHLREALPWEGCGLIAGSVHGDTLTARRFFPGDNIDRSSTRFTMEPAQVIAAFKSMRAEELELGAIVHSHPTSAAKPSPTDVREAYYPDALSVIVSFHGLEPVLKAWRWLSDSADQRFDECPVQIIERESCRLRKCDPV